MAKCRERRATSDEHLLPEHEAMASIRADGFLSEAIRRAIPHFRSLNAEWFELADNFNGVGQRLVTSTDRLIYGRSTHDPICLSARLLIRAMGAFQGAILLAERGMTQESFSLTRSIYENGFWIGYLSRMPTEAVRSFVADERVSQLGRDKALLRQIDANGLSNHPVRKDLIQRIANLSAHSRADKVDKISVDKLASRSGFKEHYVFYKQLSSGAAHPSFHSLSHYLEPRIDEAIAGHVMGPDGGGIADALNLACHAVMMCLVAVDALVGGTPETPDIVAASERYGALMEIG